jgi:fluoroacetyl-CoA thioesterase
MKIIKRINLPYVQLSKILGVDDKRIYSKRRRTMKPSLKSGLTFEFKFRVPENKTVPHLYPESPEFQMMPRVLATGFMVGLFEWACILAINPHIDWPEEQTVGIHLNLSHVAATPPGLTITVKGKLEEVDGRKLSFSLVADDGVDKISEGTHERFIINAEKFNTKMAAKARSNVGE